MPDWITADDAATLSGYHVHYIYRLAKNGAIKAQKFGATWQVSRKSLLVYLHATEKLGKRRGPKKQITS
jgi:excisionase family DNA binding protein